MHASTSATERQAQKPSQRKTEQPAAQEQEDQSFYNVASNERIYSLLAGGALALLGVRRRSNFGALLTIVGGVLIYRGATGHCPAYSALGKNTAEEQAPPEPEEYFEHGVHVEQSINVDKSPEELYRFWRKFDNLPRFMDHLESVKVIDDKRSHWVTRAPAGRHAEWDAEVINDEPNKLIAWRTLQNADVHSTGSVRFLPGSNGRGTDVQVVLDYLPPAGQVGRWVAKLFGEEPNQQVRDDLKRFKQVMEK